MLTMASFLVPRRASAADALDVLQSIDRSLTDKQLELSAPVRNAQQRAKSRLSELGSAASSEIDRLDRCVPGAGGQGGVGSGGGCTLSLNAKVPEWSRVSAAAPGSYVVLFFFPEAGFDAGNADEAAEFQRLSAEFAKLDAVVVGCSALTEAQLRSRLPKAVSFPLLPDASAALSKAFGARSLVGTARQTFIVDPSGRLRWQETNIEFGIGEFNVANHPKRVLREMFRVHNQDGWVV